MPAEAAAAICREFEDLKVPAAPSGSSMGLDGTTFELRFFEGWAESSYRWWVQPPTGWAGLERLRQRLVSLVEESARET